MSKFRRFNEYLNEKGKVQEKPKVDPEADTGPSAAKTPGKPATKGKNWKTTVPLAGKPSNYATSDKPVGKDFSEKPKGESNKKGFAHDGNKKLVYEPKTPDSWGKEGGTSQKNKSWPKTTGSDTGPGGNSKGWKKPAHTNEELLSATKGMTLAEFTQFMSSQAKVDLPSNSLDPVQATNYVAALAAQNDGIMETFVRELKRAGAFDKLVSEVFTHPEAFTEVAFMMADENSGASTARRLVRALHEVTDAPASDTEGPAAPIKAAKKVPPDMGAKGRRTKSIAGGDLDMGSSDVVQTKVTTRPEHNLINAVLGNKVMAETIIQILSK